MDPDLREPHSMGMTIISVTYDGGVVLSAHSRTSTRMKKEKRASKVGGSGFISQQRSVACSKIGGELLSRHRRQNTRQG
ncbi:Proteasome subunit beta type-6 [Platanthera guangdongensis]|uniref:Proteasome subunit beta type-6 n=1 Tax=Platanthera guangdongensis TaxID=2320717 RepID=A0ABR2N4F8_9ASPA